MLIPNHTVDVTSLTGAGLKRSYTTVVANDVAIYIYDTAEAVGTVNGAIGSQEVRAMTNEMSIRE